MKSSRDGDSSDDVSKRLSRSFTEPTLGSSLVPNPKHVVCDCVIFCEFQIDGRDFTAASSKDMDIVDFAHAVQVRMRDEHCPQRLELVRNADGAISDDQQTEYSLPGSPTCVYIVRGNSELCLSKKTGPHGEMSHCVQLGPGDLVVLGPFTFHTFRTAFLPPL